MLSVERPEFLAWVKGWFLFGPDEELIWLDEKKMMGIEKRLHVGETVGLTERGILVSTVKRVERRYEEFPLEI